MVFHNHASVVVLKRPLGVPTLFQSYSLFYEGASELLLLKRLGISSVDQLLFTDNFVAVRKDAPPLPLLVDLRGFDAMLALCHLAEDAKIRAAPGNVVGRALLSLLYSAATWQVMPNVDHCHLLSRLALAFFTFLSGVSEGACENGTNRFSELLHDWCRQVDTSQSNVNFIRSCIACCLEALSTFYTPSEMQFRCILGLCCDLCDQTIFDLRELVTGAPADFCLEEVIHEHYAPTLYAFRWIGHLIKDRGDLLGMTSTVPVAERFKNLVVDYFQVVVAYLLNSISQEPFLCSLVELLTVLFSRMGLVCTEQESIMAILQSYKYFRNYSNFAVIFKSTLSLLVHLINDAGTESGELAYQVISLVKNILFSLAKDSSPINEETLCDGGEFLGVLLKSCLARDHVYCESFVGNLMAEFPFSPEDDSQEDNGALVIILGSLAANIQDETIARICVSTLLTQFHKRGTGNPEPFQRQFCLIAASCSGTIFNNILDTLTASLSSRRSSSAYGCLTHLIELVAADPVKKEVILFTLLRLFIDKGISSISHKKSANNVDLDLLLPVICCAVETFTSSTVVNKATCIEVFQEFWLLLVLLGYVPQLSWRTEWANYIPTLATGSPVLLKEKDKLQSPGSTFSQTVLAQSMNPNLRNHLSKLLPNSSSTIRNITFAQCLWLLAIHTCQVHKFNARSFEDVNHFLRSDVLQMLGLYSFVQDIFRTIIADWKRARPTLHGQDLPLARLLVDNLCHIHPRTHRSSLLLLREFFAEEPAVYGDQAIWRTISEKIELVYFVCRTELTGMDGAATQTLLSPELTRDPTLATEAFTDVVGLARIIFAKAIKDFPNSFFEFSQSSLRGGGGSLMALGDRNVAHLELMQLSLPGPEIIDKPQAYLVAPSLLYRNVEDFVKLRDETGSQCSLSTIELVDLIAETALAEAVEPLQVKQSLRQLFLHCQGCDHVVTLLLTRLTRRMVAMRAHAMPRAEVHPLRTKLLCTPSPSPDREGDLRRASSMALLLDFLSERLSADAISNDRIMPVYAEFVQVLLGATEPVSFVQHMTFRFAFQVYWQCDVLTAEHLLSLIFAALVEYYAGQRAFVCPLVPFIYEELGCMQAVLRHLQTLQGNRERGSTKGLTDLLIFLQQIELRELRVWRGLEVERKAPVLQGGAKQVLLGPMAVLLRRVSEIHRDTLPLELGAETWRGCSRLVCRSSEMSTFLMHQQRGAPCGDWIFAAPLLLPTAVNVYQQGHLQRSLPLLNLAMRSLEQAPVDALYFYIPQLVQAMRQDPLGFIERSILHIARASPLFSHQIIWNMKATSFLDDAATKPDAIKGCLDRLTEEIVSQFEGEALSFYQREFSFFERVTGISGALKPFVKREKWEKKAKIDEELAKIAVDRGVYLPTNPECTVLDIDYGSGRPLQSHAKAPYMATFKVTPSDQPEGEEGRATWQSAIFKVGDDCRQDVLTLQFISLLRNIYALHHLPVYLHPYRVVATAPGCGIIEVIPKSISRDLLGREKINSLYEYFVFKFGGTTTLALHEARLNFIRSMAGYSLVCYLFSIKDRHNGNIMIDEAGHVIHIDFGFILDISPRLGVENAPFRLTTEFFQLMGGTETSPYFQWFRELCVSAFLIARLYARPIIELAERMLECGLPCFKGERTIRNLKARFRLDLDTQEARDYMLYLIYKSHDNLRTNIYDTFQLYSNGIPY